MKRRETPIGTGRRAIRERDGNEPLQRSGCAWEVYDPVEVLSTTSDPRETLRELLSMLPMDAVMREHTNNAIVAMDEGKLELVTATAMEAEIGLRRLTEAFEKKMKARIGVKRRP